MSVFNSDDLKAKTTPRKHFNIKENYFQVEAPWQPEVAMHFITSSELPFIANQSCFFNTQAPWQSSPSNNDILKCDFLSVNNQNKKKVNKKLRPMFVFYWEE